MARLVEKHRKAVRLRLLGKSYSQIKKEVRVSKSTLSLWLRGYPLSKERLRELGPLNERRIEKFRNTFRRKREKRLQCVYKEQKRELLPLSKKELFLAGLFLYWGEGSKTGTATVSLSNTNPKVVKFFLYWLIRILKVPKGSIAARLHIYEDMNPEEKIKFWSKELNLPRNQFKKPYVKKTTLQGLTYKGYGHGTCNLIYYDRDLIEKILMSIDAIADNVARV